MCKKVIILWLAAIMLSIGGAGYAQNMVTLDQAISYSANEIETRLESGARVMVLNFSSPSQRLSNYVLDEMTSALTRSGRLTTVERANLEFLLRELRYERSGDINDEAAQSIGRILGAQYVISGLIEELSTNYVIQFKTIPVEPAALQTLTRVGIVKDSQIASLMSADNTGVMAETPYGRMPDASGSTAIAAANLNRTFVLSAGIGAYAKIEFDHYSEDGVSRVDTALRFDIPVYLNAEILSYVLLELSPYYQNRLFFGAEERVNIIGASFSVFGQGPIRLNDRFTLYPLLGVGYEMSFYMWHKDDNASRGGEEGISNYLDFLYLRPGVKLNYNLTDSLRLDARFIWDFVLYNRLVNELHNTLHSPSLFLGVNYVFLRI